MKFIAKNVAGFNKAMRMKRVTLDDVCTSLDIRSIVSEAVADTSKNVNAIPVVGKAAGIATSYVSAINYLSKAEMEMTKTALGCVDIPFEEIKYILDEKFGEVERRLDEKAQGMEKLSALVRKTFEIVEKTRIEMNDGFEKVVNAISNNAVKKRVTQISNFVEFFNTETGRINDLGKEDFVSKLSESNSILQLLKDSRTPKMGTLQSAMNSIISNDFAIPKNEDDLVAFQTLFVLFYGFQTYVSIFGFLMKSHDYLANYYYQEGDYDKFNKQIDAINNVFNDFTASLVHGSTGLIPKVESILKKVKNKGFIGKVKTSLYKEVAQRSKLIDMLKGDIEKMKLPIIKVTPKAPTMQFKEPVYKTPLGDWKDGVKVKYAVQYMHTGMYSKIGKWSSPLGVRGKAFPTVKVPTSAAAQFRLIFRQINNDRPQLVGVLQKSQTELRDRDRDLYNAAGDPDRDLSFEMTRLFLSKAANKDAILELGRTPLHNAAWAGNVKSYNLLIERGAKIMKDRKGYTPLHLAVKEGRIHLIKDMLKSHVDPNVATTEEGYTALHLAAMNNQRFVIEELLTSSKTNVNAKDNNGFTALHAAVNKGPKTVDAIMKGKNLNVNAKSKAGHTPAHIAAMNGEYNVMRALKGSSTLDINAKDLNNMTPLHYAAMLGNDEMVKKILNAFDNIDPNPTAKNNKWTPLHYALFFKKTDSALQLLSNGKVNENAKASSDVTPLHLAAGTGQDTVIEALLSKNVNVNAKTDKGDTPLHLAAINNCKKCAALLVQKGADVKAKNKANKTPLDLATQYGKKATISFLKSKSGKRFIDYEKAVEMKFNDKVASHTVKALTDIKSNPQFLLNQNEAKAAILVPNLQFEGNGILLLLDILLRKYTDQKYYGFSNDFTPEFEAQVEAFDVTQKFEKLLNAVSTIPVAEQIDLAEVASKIKKALMGNRGNDITKILCSYAKMINSIQPEDYEKLMQSFRPKTPVLLNTEKSLYAEVGSVLSASCN